MTAKQNSLGAYGRADPRACFWRPLVGTETCTSNKFPGGADAGVRGPRSQDTEAQPGRVHCWLLSPGGRWWAQSRSQRWPGLCSSQELNGLLTLASKVALAEV